MEDQTLLEFAKETRWMAESLIRSFEQQPDIFAQSREDTKEIIYRITALHGQAEGLIEFLTQYTRN